MIRFSVDGTKHEFDPDKLTFGEARDVERVTGYPFKQLDRHLEAGEMTTLQALVWIAMKRQRTDLAFSDLDNLSVADIEFHDDEEAPDPTGGDGSTTAA